VSFWASKELLSFFPKQFICASERTEATAATAFISWQQKVREGHGLGAKARVLEGKVIGGHSGSTPLWICAEWGMQMSWEWINNDTSRVLSGG
jgi:hypothetical protein